MRDIFSHIFGFFIEMFNKIPDHFFTSKIFWIIFCFIAFAVSLFGYFCS